MVSGGGGAYLISGNSGGTNVTVEEAAAAAAANMTHATRVSQATVSSKHTPQFFFLRALFFLLILFGF